MDSIGPIIGATVGAIAIVAAIVRFFVWRDRRRDLAMREHAVVVAIARYFGDANNPQPNDAPVTLPDRMDAFEEHQITVLKKQDATNNKIDALRAELRDHMADEQHQRSEDERARRQTLAHMGRMVQEAGTIAAALAMKVEEQARNQRAQRDAPRRAQPPAQSRRRKDPG